MARPRTAIIGRMGLWPYWAFCSSGACNLPVGMYDALDANGREKHWRRVFHSKQSRLEARVVSFAMRYAIASQRRTSRLRFEASVIIRGMIFHFLNSLMLSSCEEHVPALPYTYKNASASGQPVTRRRQ